VTPTIIRVISGVFLLSVGLSTLMLGISGLMAMFSDQVLVGIATLFIGCPLMAILGVLFARIYTELLIVLFRIAENLVQIEGHTRRA
jgi:hypothetical protein